jgi:hypothetical protein
MVPGPNPGIWVLELIPGIMSTERGFPPTRNTCSSTAVTGGIRIALPIRLTSTGWNSRNICPNPIDDLEEYPSSEKEICYEANKK